MPECGLQALSSPPGCASTSRSPSSTPPPGRGAVCVIVVHVSIGWLFGPYAVGHELGSFEETAEVARAASVAGFVLAMLTLLLRVVELPRTVPLIALALAVMGMFAARFLIRSRRTHRAVHGDSTKRAIIFGAGSGGRILMQSLVRDPASDIVPVALLDDDRGKARLHFSGVRVRGTRDDLACVTARYAATTLVIAVPSATSETVRELSALARENGLEVLVLPAGARAARGAAHGIRPAQPRRRRPARPPAGGPRHGRDRRPDRRQAGARHRRRWLDRLRAVPPDRQVRAVPPAHARP